MSVAMSIKDGMGTNLGDSAVVDLDQVTRGRVDLQALVESQSRFNGLGSC